ncbi:MAG: hypothetical protein ACRDHW_12385 [Ktedonobacteraceae bacterium]
MHICQNRRYRQGVFDERQPFFTVRLAAHVPGKLKGLHDLSGFGG